MTSNGLASGRFKADRREASHSTLLSLPQEVQDAKYSPEFRKQLEKFRGENFHQDKDTK